MWDGFDKRKFPRMSLNCEIQLKTLDKKETVNAVTENVGAGGVCVMVERALDRFSSCGIRIDLGSGTDIIECVGKVVWIIPTKDAKGKKNRYDIGIEFVDMPESGQLALKKRIEEVSSSQID